MKNINVFSLIALFVLGMTLSGCYKDKEWDWVSQNTTASGKYAPVSSNTLYDLNLTNPNNTTNPKIPISINATSATNRHRLAAGYTLRTELQYYCIDPIKEIVLYEALGTGAKAIKKTYPYQPAFSKNKGVDTLIIEYALPELATNADINLEIDVISTKGQGLVGSTGATANISSPRRIFLRLR